MLVHLLIEMIAEHPHILKLHADRDIGLGKGTLD